MHNESGHIDSEINNTSAEMVSSPDYGGSAISEQPDSLNEQTHQVSDELRRALQDRNDKVQNLQSQEKTPPDQLEETRKRLEESTNCKLEEDTKEGREWELTRKQDGSWELVDKTQGNIVPLNQADADYLQSNIISKLQNGELDVHIDLESKTISVTYGLQTIINELGELVILYKTISFVESVTVENEPKGTEESPSEDPSQPATQPPLAQPGIDPAPTLLLGQPEVPADQLVSNGELTNPVHLVESTRQQLPTVQKESGHPLVNSQAETRALGNQTEHGKEPISEHIQAIDKIQDTTTLSWKTSSSVDSGQEYSAYTKASNNMVETKAGNTPNAVEKTNILKPAHLSPVVSTEPKSEEPITNYRTQATQPAESQYSPVGSTSEVIETPSEIEQKGNLQSENSQKIRRAAIERFQPAVSLPEHRAPEHSPSQASKISRPTPTEMAPSVVEVQGYEYAPVSAEEPSQKYSSSTGWEKSAEISANSVIPEKMSRSELVQSAEPKPVVVSHEQPIISLIEKTMQLAAHIEVLVQDLSSPSGQTEIQIAYEEKNMMDLVSQPIAAEITETIQRLIATPDIQRVAMADNPDVQPITNAIVFEIKPATPEAGQAISVTLYEAQTTLEKVPAINTQAPAMPMPALPERQPKTEPAPSLEFWVNEPVPASEKTTESPIVRQTDIQTREKPKQREAQTIISLQAEPIVSRVKPSAATEIKTDTDQVTVESIAPAEKPSLKLGIQNTGTPREKPSIPDRETSQPAKSQIESDRETILEISSLTNRQETDTKTDQVRGSNREETSSTAEEDQLTQPLIIPLRADFTPFNSSIANVLIDQTDEADQTATAKARQLAA